MLAARVEKMILRFHNSEKEDVLSGQVRVVRTGHRVGTDIRGTLLGPLFYEKQP